MLAIFDCAQAGLIAGTVPTKGTAKRARNSVERQRGRGVAGDHDQVGRVLRDRLAQHGGDALDQRAFGQIAIRKAGVVGQIEIARVRPRGGNLAEHGEAAQAGVEDEDGGGASSRSA